MQAQLNAQSQEQLQAQEIVTAARSLNAVKTLITAGFGCMTYLRGLLPDENFEDARLSSVGTTMYNDKESNGKAHVSGVRIKTVRRGYSTEGDQMLNYLEQGVFDALEKQYLQSFIFAVYLDKDDPSNIVEAWTFNFQYHQVPGTNTAVPVFSINRAMSGMSLAGDNDPIMSASMQGKNITLGEVKRSVKNLVRGLIAASQGLETLPTRRFATFKLFYKEHTPEDYEPPFFIPVDSTSNTFIFSTHHPKEVPEKIGLGTLETPYHTVALNVASIASLLPSNEDNFARYSGLTQNSKGSGKESLMEDQISREQANEAQMQDATRRRVVWDADADARPESPGNEDAVGEPDPDVVTDSMEPLGVRGPDGDILPLPVVFEHTVTKSKRKDERGARHTSQTSEDPTTPSPSQGDSTQPVNQEVQSVRDGKIAVRASTEGHLDVLLETLESNISHGIDTQYLQEIMMVRKFGAAETVSQTSQSINNRTDSQPHTDMLVDDAISSFSKTSLTPKHADDPIGSFSPPRIQQISTPGDLGDSIMDDPQTPQAAPFPAVESTPIARQKTTNARGTSLSEAGFQTQTFHEPESMQETFNHHRNTECDCGSYTEEYDWVHCEKCDRWLHTWCMGYNSNEDERLSTVFQCFSCQLVGEPASTLLDKGQLDDALSRWKELALFRRALKVTRLTANCPDTQAAFRKKLGIGAAVAGQLWRRLEFEGFIAAPEAPVDLLESIGTNSKKKSRPRKGATSTKRVAVRTLAITNAFEMYFQPGGEFETRTLGLNTLSRRGRLERNDDAQIPHSFASLSPAPRHASNSAESRIPNPAQQPLALEVVTGSAKKSTVGNDPQVSASGLSSLSQAPHSGPQGTKRKFTGASAGIEVPNALKKAKRIKMSMLSQPVDLEEY